MDDNVALLEPQGPKMDASRQKIGRRIIAFLLLVSIIAYSGGVIGGVIHKDNRLQLSELALIVVACAVVGLVLRPDLVRAD